MKRFSRFIILMAFSCVCNVQSLARINADCTLKGIPLHGKVQFVDTFADLKVRFVDSFPDLKVRFVKAFPNQCGMWQRVEAFPDFKVKVVDALRI